MNIPTLNTTAMQELANDVGKAGGLITLTASDIRDIAGFDRLGKIVRSQISEALSELGIKHIPEDFPDRQWDEVRLYQSSSKIGRLIYAAVTPGKGHDDHLREVAANEASELLNQVRDLVCAEETNDAGSR